VYERLGFQVGEATELSLPPAIVGRTRSSTVHGETQDMEQLLTFDRRTFGGDRTRLLHAFGRREDARCYVATNGDDTTGYLFARKRLLGPGGARYGDTARDLVHAALSDRSRTGDSGEQRLLLPLESGYPRRAPAGRPANRTATGSHAPW
jgi:Acetyltransferase (GNAT) domain